jgi:hypothetical protein
VSLPVVTTEVALVNNPADTSLTWVDISDYVEEFTSHRGRNDELDRFEAGTATLLLDNNDRRFDPTYTSGPNYRNLLPMKRIRVTLLWDSVVYPLFYGFVDAWPQEYPGEGLTTYVPLRCTDLFKSLSLASISGSYPSELTGARINRVLDAVGWPAGDRDIDAGQSTLQAVTLDSVSALVHLQDVNNSENGLLFLSRDGKVTFIDRHALILAAQDTSLVWGDDGSEYPYTGITLDASDANLWNHITVTADGLTEQTVIDSTSTTQYLPRSYQRATLLSTTTQMSDMAYFLRSRYSQPTTRVVGMSTDCMPTGSLTEIQSFAAVLGREIGDKIRVRRRPTGGGNVIEQDSVVEAISCSISGTSFDFSFNLSPADSVSAYWVLGDPVQGLLGSTSRLSY